MHVRQPLPGQAAVVPSHQRSQWQEGELLRHFVVRRSEMTFPGGNRTRGAVRQILVHAWFFGTVEALANVRLGSGGGSRLSAPNHGAMFSSFSSGDGHSASSFFVLGISGVNDPLAPASMARTRLGVFLEDAISLAQEGALLLS